ncbi:hypothetical protein FOYG_10885 [Fusarium oxysporum NRRL 32931]|uniref:Uncharacterized protein n=1 Tax=Fusarium oxysporum NRRL 32931 TaxID=660029 RepID=W9I1D1_FUSOX|nr:hypothetical protein FOYG_10885 [Fusarium oxysporum NRRL 32931]
MKRQSCQSRGRLGSQTLEMEALHESLAHVASIVTPTMTASVSVSVTFPFPEEFPTLHAPSSHSPVTSTLPKRGNFRDHYRFFPSSGQLYSFSRKPHFSRSDSNRGPLPELARGLSREIEMSSSLGTSPRGTAIATATANTWKLRKLTIAKN